MGVYGSTRSRPPGPGIERTSTDVLDAQTRLVGTPLALEGTSQPLPRANHFLEVYARLKPGVPFERARAEMDRVAAELQRPAGPHVPISTNPAVFRFGW